MRLCEALAARGLAPAPLVIPSLKDPQASDFIRGALMRLAPAVIVTTTAFAAGGDSEASPLDCVDAPVLQVVIATTRRAAWQESPRGLGPADLAMHVVLPELDGRVLAGAIAFKDALPKDDALAFTAFASRPEPDRIGMVADRIAALARLQKTQRDQRRIAVLMPDYPAAGGRAGYAVGLDVPASIVALLADLADAGYRVKDAPRSSRSAARSGRRGRRRSGTFAATTIAGFSPTLPAEVASPHRSGLGRARRRPRLSATAPSASAPPSSAMCWWRFRPIAGAAATGAPPITIPSCRRAMPSSPSGCGCGTWSRPTRSCIWARTARSNGCRGRPWR